MNFKSEVLSALQAGAKHPRLYALLVAAHAEGMSQRQAHALLSEIWQENGFDCNEGKNTEMQDELEYLMENAWGWCGPNPWGGWLESSSDGVVTEHRPKGRP